MGPAAPAGGSLRMRLVGGLRLGDTATDWLGSAVLQPASVRVAEKSVRYLEFTTPMTMVNDTYNL